MSAYAHSYEFVFGSHNKLRIFVDKLSNVCIFVVGERLEVKLKAFGLPRGGDFSRICYSSFFVDRNCL
jgi:hypothetical protein